MKNKENQLNLERPGKDKEKYDTLANSPVESENTKQGRIEAVYQRYDRSLGNILPKRLTFAGKGPYWQQLVKIDVFGSLFCG